MFENILDQNATDLLSDDIKSSRLPGSILFYGPQGTGKFSCALETARVLSCSCNGDWNCNCESCKKHRVMVNPNLLIIGSGNRTLEIAASKNTLLAQNAQNTSHLESARYLYIRAVRKLTVRFSTVLWEGEDKLAKFSPLVQAIDEGLEQIQPGRTLPDGDELQKILDEIEKNSAKLETSFLYDSIPVSQIRNFSSWAHLASNSGKKVLVIENADLMAESSRNALLKILEEPPVGVEFILTTSRRGAILPTILSRVRTYNFRSRTVLQNRNLIDRVFHYDPSFNRGIVFDDINDFIESYLPVKPDFVKSYSLQYFKSICEGHVPDIASIVSSCSGFEPRVLFRIFLQGIIGFQRKLLESPCGAECSGQIVEAVRNAYQNVSIYNQNPLGALEELTRTLMQINYLNGSFLRQIEF